MSLRYVQGISDIFLLLAEHIEQMSPKEKAILRIQLREQFKLPPMPEPDAYKN